VGRLLAHGTPHRQAALPVATVGRFVRRFGLMAEVDNSHVLSRLRSVGADADRSLLVLLALARLARSGDRDTPWSVAEVAFADLASRFGTTPAATDDAEVSAARAFLGLSHENFWALDAEVPSDHPRTLNQRRVSARLDPVLEQALRRSPALIHQAARQLAATFPGTDPELLLAAVGLDTGPAPPRPEGRPAVRGLGAYLKLTATDARAQFRQLLTRADAPDGQRQVDFIPVETLLCLAASYQVNHRRYGGSTAHTAPTRAEGIGTARLPDFLDLEEGGQLDLLGQDELATISPDDLQTDDDKSDQDPETERIRLAAARVGQHLFAQNVLANCASTCVFCGLRPAAFGARRMLMAGHIKPWRDSSPTERLDTRNGLAACPAHDVAFDTGLLTVGDDLTVHIADQLARSVLNDEMTRHYYGQPPMLPALRLPPEAQRPLAKYLSWHRRYIFR